MRPHAAEKSVVSSLQRTHYLLGGSGLTERHRWVLCQLSVWEWREIPQRNQQGIRGGLAGQILFYQWQTRYLGKMGFLQYGARPLAVSQRVPCENKLGLWSRLLPKSSWSTQWYLQNWFQHHSLFPIFLSQPPSAWAKYLMNCAFSHLRDFRFIYFSDEGYKRHKLWNIVINTGSRADD